MINERSGIMADKTDEHISKITFNNGKDVNINKNDIIIFVGPTMLERVNP